jgi:SET domain-containing protein
MIKDLSFYNFDSPNGKIINASIDAQFMGNKAKFINHGNDGEHNVRLATISSNGTKYIALYA